MAALIFVALSLLLLLVKTERVPPLSRDALYNSSTGRPVCAFFKHSGGSSDQEGLLSRFLQDGIFAKNYADWIVGSVDLRDITQLSPPPNLYPTTVPSLQCDVGLPHPLEFAFQDTSYKSLKRWFKLVAKKRKEQPKVVSLSGLEKVLLNNNKGVTIVIFPGPEYSQYIREFVHKIRKRIRGVQFEILLSQYESQSHNELRESFGVKQYPTLLFFTYQVWIDSKTFTYKLQGFHEINFNSFELSLKITSLQASFLDEENFRADVVDTKYQLPPKLVCVFSNANPTSLVFVSTFEEIRKQLQCESAELEFRLMNVGDRNNLNVFVRHVNASGIKGFPVFILFWQEITPSYELLTRQHVFDGIPSASQVYSFLMRNNILITKNRQRSGKCFSEEDERVLECVNPLFRGGFCETNISSFTHNFPSRYYPLRPRGSEMNGGRKMHNAKKLWPSRRDRIGQKMGNLTVLNDKDWSDVVEATFITRKQFHQQQGILPTLNLIVFIRKNCRYCQMVTPSLEELAQSISHIHRASLYLINCSSSPNICARYDVNGYPSVKLFRNIPWVDVTGCLTDHFNKRYIIQDYHGPLQPHTLILEWLSHASLPIIKKDFLLRDIPHKLNHDVHLVGTVITRSHALQYLPASSSNNWYSFRCFQTVCELLFGKAVCYATMVKDFGVSPDMEKARERDLFVIKLTLFRRDGVQSKIFELGVPLQKTIASDQRDAELHKFHNAHRYNLPSRLFCEEDHPLCTEFIVKYVSDHSRLPVTRLTHDGFHTVKRFVNDGEQSWSDQLPVVVVLAYSENLTTDSLYFQEITKAAYELYRDVIFTALDVDEYPWWASRFVPKDYGARESFTSDGPSMLPLYHFPRICIVMATDHHKAAFFPSLQDMIDTDNVPELLNNVTAQDVTQFIQRFLLDPNSMLLQTKEF